MLVPIYLGLCSTADLDKGHEAAGALINTNLSMAVLVSVVHSIAMIAAGGSLAFLRTGAPFAVTRSTNWEQKHCGTLGVS